MAKKPTKGRKRPNDTAKTPDQAGNSAESVTEAKPLFDAIPPEVHTPAAATVTDETPAPVSEPVVEDPEPTPAPTPVAAKQSTNGGFVPLALGGLVAGVIGFAVATLTAPAGDDDVTVQMAQQAALIEQLQQRLAELDVPDTTQLQSDLEAQIGDVSSRVAEITARLDAIEDRPVVVTSDGSEAISADMEALRAQLSQMADAAQTELDEARAAAAAIEENAAEAARNAAARAALARVQTAMESGSPIGAALGDLEDALGTTAPTELIAVQDGVPTLTALQDTFPDAARAALATARSEGVAGEETTGLTAFLRNQFDVRSTAPREGQDADAVLSRAEAALRGGRLSDALAEISGLPEVARAEMSDWLAQAEARASAVAAADMLSTSLSDN